MRNSLVKLFICWPVFMCIMIGTVNCQAVSEPIQVFVSILPQKYFVQRIAGNKISVEVMVGPGQSPETFEPTPRQLASLARTRIYFSIGVPFEHIWMPKISTVNPDLKIIDLYSEAQSSNGGLTDDPHIWSSPANARLIAARIRDVLVEYDPLHADLYQMNFMKLDHDLEELDQTIKSRLKPWMGSGKFLVMHPAWGYFAKAYGLEQIAIEHHGKEPAAKTLASLIGQARQDRIQVVFIQDQHSVHMAETVAKAIGAKVVKLDPLAENYIENMERVVDAIAESLQR